jgi:hypothetical protein
MFFKCDSRIKKCTGKVLLFYKNNFFFQAVHDEDCTDVGGSDDRQDRVCPQQELHP